MKLFRASIGLVNLPTFTRKNQPNVRKHIPVPWMVWVLMQTPVIPDIPQLNLNKTSGHAVGFLQISSWDPSVASKHQSQGRLAGESGVANYGIPKSTTTRGEESSLAHMLGCVEVLDLIYIYIHISFKVSQMWLFHTWSVWVDVWFPFYSQKTWHVLRIRCVDYVHILA